MHRLSKQEEGEERTDREYQIKELKNLLTIKEILDTIKADVEYLYKNQHLDTGAYESLMGSIEELEAENIAQGEVIEETAREEAEA